MTEDERTEFLADLLDLHGLVVAKSRHTRLNVGFNPLQCLLRAIDSPRGRLLVQDREP